MSFTIPRIFLGGTIYFAKDKYTRPSNSAIFNWSFAVLMWRHRRKFLLLSIVMRNYYKGSSLRIWKTGNIAQWQRACLACTRLVLDLQHQNNNIDSDNKNNLKVKKQESTTTFQIPYSNICSLILFFIICFLLLKEHVYESNVWEQKNNNKEDVHTGYDFNRIIVQFIFSKTLTICL